MYNSSPTNSLTVVGRRSPNHDQMDAIAEDTTEDSTTPTNIHPPPIVIRSGVVDEPTSLHNRVGEGGGGLSPNRGSSGNFSGPGPRPSTPDEGRQRRSGALALKSPVSPQMVFSFLETGDLNGSVNCREKDGKKSTEGRLCQGAPPNGLHQLLSQPPQPPAPPTSVVANPFPPSSSTAVHPPASIASSSNGNSSNTLLGMLKSPVVNDSSHQQPHQHKPHLHHQPRPQYQTLNSDLNSAVVYPNSNNYHLVQASFPPTAARIQPISCAQQMQKVSEGDVLISQISSLLDNSGITYINHQNNVISVKHPVVHFQIHVTNKVQTAFIAGDTMQYQSLCSQLFSRLTQSVQ